MATVDETFDPNDLDSIDALLDEAEQEAVSGRDEDLLPDVTEPEAESVAEAAPEPKSEPQVRDEPVDMSVEDDVMPAQRAKPNSEPARREFKEDEEAFTPRRKTSQKQSPNGASVAGMEAIKKLIIMFGSVLIVLTLAAIGTSIWSLSSSGEGNGEALTMLEDIKAGTEQNTLSQSESQKRLQEFEQKLDALSFQMGQLTADLAAMESRAESKNPEVVAVAETAAPVTDAAASVTPVVQPVASEVSHQLGTLQNRVVRAQSRIDEVNRRVKGLQDQHAQVLRSVKLVEKQLLDQQLQASVEAKAKEQAKAEQARSVYQYPAPDGDLYDQANPDSYP